MLSLYLLALGRLALGDDPHLQTYMGSHHQGISAAFREPEGNFGLVTFAHTTPLRCLGEDADEKFDVAILGKYLLRDPLVFNRRSNVTMS